MKRLIIILSLLLPTLFASAQTIYLCKDGAYTTRELTDGLEITPNELDSITFDVPNFPAAVVKINFFSSKTSVDVPAYAKNYISYTINGENIVINNTQTDGKETTYVVSGNTTNGSLTINGQYKMTVMLNGCNIISKNTPAIDIQCGKRTDFIINEYTSNVLEDSPSNTGKAALYCKGHMEIKGTGTLTVDGKANHAIATKEYLEVKGNSNITINSAVNDAIHAGQYYKQTSGTVWVDKNVKGDGIQVEATSDATDENNGQMFIKGGIVNITVNSEDCKGLKADKDIAITGGDIYINANGNGSRGIQTSTNLTVSQADSTTSISINAAGGKCTLAECADDPHKCTGIKIDGDMTVSAGTITVNNTGKKSKGIKVGGTYYNNGGKVTAVIEATNTL